MKKMNKSSNKHLLAFGLAFGAAVAATSVSAANGVSVLDDAILDYAGQAPSDEISQGSSVDTYETDVVLSESYYDWTLKDFQGLEEAEFAAFEVPDALRIHD